MLADVITRETSVTALPYHAGLKDTERTAGEIRRGAKDGWSEATAKAPHRPLT